MSDPTPVAEVVRPERPARQIYPAHGSGFIAMYPSDVAESHFGLLETKLAEAIAQRDEARKELDYYKTPVLRMPNGFLIDRGAIRSLIIQNFAVQNQVVTALLDELEKAEAALATERARVLQEVANKIYQHIFEIMQKGNPNLYLPGLRKAKEIIQK